MNRIGSDFLGGSKTKGVIFNHLKLETWICFFGAWGVRLVLLDCESDRHEDFFNQCISAQISAPRNLSKRALTPKDIEQQFVTRCDSTR